MTTKKNLVEGWLPRYTGTPVGDFGKQILLCNFNDYVERFAEINDVPVIELQIFLDGGTKVGLLSGRGTRELEWMATELRRALWPERGPATIDEQPLEVLN